MARSRSGKAFLNTTFSLILEVVTAICSFILPRLILSHFGSAYNGITSSITQFISSIGLLQSGIGGVTRAALYKLLAAKDSRGISEVVNATSHFMKRIALIFVIFVLTFGALFPALVSNEFNWLFTFSLVLILSIDTFAQYYFGFAYQMVVRADQLEYVISIVRIIAIIANTIIAAILINVGCGIHVVKLGSAIVYALPPVFYNIWVKRKYHVDTRIEPKTDVLKQRWDAFGHQVANFINTNTDIMLATIFLGVREVSVYSIYYMIGNAIKKFVMSLASGLSAAFGNMLAKHEDAILKQRFEQFEILVCIAATTLLVITAKLMCPFVSIYTSGVHDVNYIRPIFSYLICGSIYFSSLKIPYEELVYAAGAFKNTRNGAFIEAGINIVISIILIGFIGLDGIIIGTIIAISYRTIRYHLYISKMIIPRNKAVILRNFLFTILTTITSFIVYSFLPEVSTSGYISWAGSAILISIVTTLVSFMMALIVYRKGFIGLLDYFKGLLLRRKFKR